MTILIYNYLENYTKLNWSKIYDYVDLNTKIETLKKLLKDYYKNQIQDKLFEFELLK